MDGTELTNFFSHNHENGSKTGQNKTGRDCLFFEQILTEWEIHLVQSRPFLIESHYCFTSRPKGRNFYSRLPLYSLQKLSCRALNFCCRCNFPLDLLVFGNVDFAPLAAHFRLGAIL